MSDECKLVADEHLGAYRVGWYFHEDGEIGGCLGDAEDHATRPPTGYSEAAEHHIATYATAQAFPDVDRDIHGFRFETFAQAKKSLAVAKRALADAKANRVSTRARHRCCPRVGGADGGRDCGRRMRGRLRRGDPSGQSLVNAPC